MSETVKAEQLTVTYPGFTLGPCTFSMEEGEILVVAGESGSGKTTLARAVSCLLDGGAKVDGRVETAGFPLYEMREKERKKIRMEAFSIVFQNSYEWLNPSMRLQEQLAETLIKKYPAAEHGKRMAELMEMTGLSSEDLKRYPKELSGGMAQKFLLANGLALSPKLVILDEPTSSMDAKSRKSFMELINRIKQEKGTSFLMVTHDLRLAKEIGSRILILYGGSIVEMGPAGEVLHFPKHPYTQGLLRASMDVNLIKDIWGIRPPDRVEEGGCPFAGRCSQRTAVCLTKKPELTDVGNGRMVACNRGGIVSLMETEHVEKKYGPAEVVKDVSLTIGFGEFVSLVGKSGVGKTTFARILGGYGEDFKGRVRFDGKEADYSVLHRSKHGIQMVFQDCDGALNPAMTVAEAVGEPLFLSGKASGNQESREEISKKVKSALKDADLPAHDGFLKTRIRSLSGGQKQRVCIARALTMEPALLIADEPTSMLDPSGKANILRLLKGLQNSKGFSMLMVTHDLACAAKVSDRIFLMKQGKLVPFEPVTENLECSIFEMGEF